MVQEHMMGCTAIGQRCFKISLLSLQVWGAASYETAKAAVMAADGVPDLSRVTSSVEVRPGMVSASCCIIYLDLPHSSCIHSPTP